MTKYAVQVKDIRKQFSYSNHRNNSLKSAITQVFKPKDTSINSFYALDGISFNVEKGDFFGVLGRNGSGKSTLLKIISEIYQPTSGNVKHDGRVVSFIELGVGFKAELSGRENVYLNGGLLGFSKQEVDSMYDEIVEFAELEQFMDQKLKNYSSGMKVRLAFSVAIRAKADILILDEVLAVGDASFQEKCFDYFRTLKDDGKTVILVTHGMGAVRDFCNKAIVIEGGKIIFEGGADEAADEYLKLFRAKPQNNSIDTFGDSDALSIESVKTAVDKKKIKISVRIRSRSGSDKIKLGLSIFNDKKRLVTGVGSYRMLGDEFISLGRDESKDIIFELYNTVGSSTFHIQTSAFVDSELVDVKDDLLLNPNKSSYYPTVALGAVEIQDI